MSARLQRFAWLPLALLLAACGVERAENETGDDHAAEELQLFDRNKGVCLPPELQRSLGLATAEAREKQVTPRLQTTAHVYRAQDGKRPAAAVAWLSGAEAERLRVRQNLHLSSSGTPATSVAATLIRLTEPASSAAPDPIEALIEFEDAERRFPPGSSLVATFVGERAHAALTVPESSVIHGAGGAFVYAANGAHFTRTPVNVGASVDGWVEITDGLYAGDIVVAEAAEVLWLIELCALKGGTPCCPVPTRKQGK